MEENYTMNPIKRFTFLLIAAVVALPLALTGCPKSAEELVEDSTEDVQLQQDMTQDQETAAQNEAAQDEGAMGVCRAANSRKPGLAVATALDSVH